MASDTPSTPPSGEATRTRRAPRSLSAIRKAMAEGARPQFSQPVRQIVMLLLVLGLVVAGAFLAYARIYRIFQSNMMLNGLILAVFVFGVLTCFWQVAELIRSVSWIERFAARRASALEAGVAPRADSDTDAAPRMLAPLAALLGTRGPAGGIISTSSARSIQESVATRIDEGRDITRYVAQLLIFLGLLGTFYGLAITIPGVVDTIRGLAPAEGETGVEMFSTLMNGLETQLGGMATAFSSSLIGLAGSLIVGLLELFVTHGQNRFYRELEEWMTSFTRVSVAATEASGQGAGMERGALSGFLDQIAGQMQALTEFYATRDEIYEQDQLAADERALVMARGVERLTQHVLADGDAAIARATQLQDALARLIDGQERLITLTGRRGGPVEGDGDARSHLRSIDLALGRVVDEMSSGRADMMLELRADIAHLTRAVKALGTAEVR